MEVTANPLITELTIEDSPVMNGIIDSDEDKNNDSMSASSHRDQNISTTATESSESQVCDVCVTLQRCMRSTAYFSSTARYEVCSLNGNLAAIFNDINLAKF